jgi:hypothetical protein
MLCRTCERIDFCKYIDVPMRHEVALGQLQEIIRKSDRCSFCSLVCFAIQKVSTTQRALGNAICPELHLADESGELEEIHCLCSI